MEKDVLFQTLRAERHTLSKDLAEHTVRKDEVENNATAKENEILTEHENDEDEDCKDNWTIDSVKLDNDDADDYALFTGPLTTLCCFI